MKKKTLKIIVLFSGFTCINFLILINFLYAAVPQQINYQGKLFDSAGDPVSDGNRNITFRIFNVSGGGTALWSEIQSVNTQDGLFNVILGSVSLISLDFNQDYWLEIQVSGDGAMTPRHRLVSVPYTFRAEDANNSEQLNSQSAGYYLDAGNINSGTLGDSRLSANVTLLGSNIDAGEITTNIVSSVDGVTNDGGNINLIAGTNMTIAPNDSTNTITFSASTSGDNLGNHIATQNLRLNGYYLSGDGGNEGISVDNSGNVNIGAKLAVGGTTTMNAMIAGLGNDSLGVYAETTNIVVPALRARADNIQGTTCWADLGMNMNGIIAYSDSGTWTGNMAAIYGLAANNSYSGYFTGGQGVKIDGNLEVTGTVSKGGGTFVIDHPLYPRNKVLKHSFVESPEMKNVYDGIVILDKKGEAMVKLPLYFESLNEKFRYQLTPIGGNAPLLYIKKEINNNQFVIGGGHKNLKVSWQITGIRKDAYALKNPIIVEQDKGIDNNYKKGEYLHPEVYGK